LAILGSFFLNSYFLDTSRNRCCIVNSRTTQYDLIKSREDFEELSKTDLNTNLFNRNAFISFLDEFPGHVDNEVCVVYIDANGLHEINNTKGHKAGDYFLKSIADCCKENFPDSDVYRMGGDEFLVYSDNMGLEKCSEIMGIVDAKLKEKEYNIAFGIESATGEFDLKGLVDIANKKMLVNKSEFYKAREHDRRTNR